MIKFSSLLALFAGQLNFSGWKTPNYQRQYGARRQVRAAFKLTGRPTDKRHWHDRTEFYQSNALEAAVLKRRRRADRQQFVTARAAKNNDARFTDGAMPTRLNPFYVAK